METRRYVEEAESYMKQLYSFGCFDIVPRFRRRPGARKREKHAPAFFPM